MRRALVGAVLLAALALPQSALAAQTLNVSKAGAGSGTVSSEPAGIDCGETCSAAFADNAVVLLSGVAGPNSAAVKWAGCDAVTIENRCKVTMSGTKNVTATFGLIERKLSIEKPGTGTGTVTSSPAGIDCGSVCSAEYEHGTEVTLSAVSGANTEAVKWSGCGSVDLENRCLVTLAGAKTVNATFNLNPQTLIVKKGGLGTGTVTSSPAGISCGGTCSFVFGEGQQILLTGTPSGESEAVKWSGCDSVTGEGKCVVAMSAKREVGAVFNVKGPTLTVARQGTGTGTVTSNPAAIECGAACAVNFPQDSKVTLSGTPGLHSQAVKWAGCDELTKANACIVTMSEARQVNATFELEPQYALYPISISLIGTGTGTVTSTPAGISCPPDCAEEYVTDTALTLYALPAPGSEFDHWSVTACGTSTLCSRNVSGPRTINAVFTAVGTRTLTVAKAGSGQGTVVSTNVGGIECGSSCAAEYDAKAKVTLTATASLSSTFTGWSGEGCTGTKNCRVAMNEARNVTATFAANPAPPIPKCRVPKLRGKSLKQARRALFKHNCSPGKVRKPKGKGGRLVVRSSKPGAGAVRRAGTRVSIKLVRKKRRR